MAGRRVALAGKSPVPPDTTRHCLVSRQVQELTWSRGWHVEMTGRMVRLASIEPKAEGHMIPEAVWIPRIAKAA